MWCQTALTAPEDDGKRNMSREVSNRQCVASGKLSRYAEMKRRAPRAYHVPNADMPAFVGERTRRTRSGDAQWRRYTVSGVEFIIYRIIITGVFTNWESDHHQLIIVWL